MSERFVEAIGGPVGLLRVQENQGEWEEDVGPVGVRGALLSVRVGRDCLWKTWIHRHFAELLQDMEDLEKQRKVGKYSGS